MPRNGLRRRMWWNRIVVSILVSWAVFAFSANTSSADGQTFAGAWNVTIAFDDPVLVGCTTPSLNTKDGGIVAQGCDVSESPGYGQWRRIDNDQFAATFVGVNFGAPGTGITGTYKVRATLVVSGDTFSGPFLTEIFNLDGRLLFSVTGSVTGQRIEVEPLQS
jgi:hypothetical protein